MSLYAGLDIGGTKFIAASSDNTGKIIRRTKAPTPLELEDGLNLLNDMITEVSEGKKLTGIGTAIGGPLDWKQGVVSPLHQPKWRNVPLKKRMEKQWNCPFSVDVDTNIAALAEYYVNGESKGKLLYLTISTGMGGGFIVDGKIYRGMNGEHPEVGHQSVNFKCSDPSLVTCECGAKDCLEALVSGNGIRRIYNKPPEKLNENEWEEVTYNLAQGLRNLATIYLPDEIVLGGGIALGRGKPLISGIKKIMKKNIKLVPIPNVRFSGLGYDTVLLGALYAAKYGVH
ncbi:MAG: ROK family protein [Bacteroidales bacterium]|nr:ROK family protein [Bacteroidales bacterium]